MAVGHPGETPWSFTSGVVSSIHQGIIQTDASINKGNSGGPLIDASGRVVGISTSRLVGDTQGIGFARPVSLAKALVQGNAQSIDVDRSTPEFAMRTCARGYEMGSEKALDCSDEDTAWDHHQEALRRAVAKMSAGEGAKGKSRERAFLPSPATRTSFLAHRRAMSLAQLRGEDPLPALSGLREESSPTAGDAGAFLRIDSTKVHEALQKTADHNLQDRDDDIFKRTGLKVDRKNPRAEADRFKMGLRVERVLEIDAAHAWVAVRGRNVDASEYRLSTFLVRRADGWRIVEVPRSEDEKTLPKDWPPCKTSYEEDMKREVELAEGFSTVVEKAFKTQR